MSSASGPCAFQGKCRLLGILCTMIVHGSIVGAQDFPNFRTATVPPQLEGVWLASPIVAIGDVRNVASFGRQAVDDFTSPNPAQVHEIYWCRGDFHVVAVVKGELQSAVRKYLWASIGPGCELVDNNPQLIYRKMKTKFWFLRNEGRFLRPTFDFNAYKFYGVSQTWSEGSPLPPKEKLGALLLKPSANSDSLDDYARYLWNVGNIACELLGKPECARRIRRLERLGNTALRDSACDFLQAQLGTNCEVK